MSNFRKYFAVAKVNFRYATWIAYLAAGIAVLAMVGDMIVDAAIGETGFVISPYSMLYVIPVLAPILFSTTNYVRLMNIGVKKKNFFGACIINYFIFALAIALIGTLEYYFVDELLGKTGYEFYGIINIFGWNTSVFDAFFSQFAFMMLLQTTIHTLTFMQTKWYGWVADILIAAIISVFTPIPALRAVEVFFFDITLFARPAIIHIAVCLALAAGFYATNLFYLKHRE